MITWTGRGFVVPLVVFGCVLVAEVVSEAAFRDDTYYQAHGWPMALGLAVAGAVLQKMSGWAHVSPPGQPPADASFFWVPVRYWPTVLFAVAGAVSLHAVFAG